MENNIDIKKFEKPYNAKDMEPEIYKIWEGSGFFNPDVCISKGKIKNESKPFTIIMPPPNVTGVLHMGHGLMITLQDVMVRFKRMSGYKTLWLPGTDHAAIATQSKVEKEIYKKEGKSRHDLGRDELLKRVSDFAKESHDTITSQIKIMGASCDWSREAFTLDQKRNIAVNTVFKKMYDDGLIYRAHKIVNWDPKGQTTISDDEIVYEERKAFLYTFKYSKDFPISISTTRPETKIGDTAVAVHPEDTRYKEYVGKEYDINFCGSLIHIKIIADDSVDPDFGTGALGVTSAHSMIDALIAEKHNLPFVQVINEYAKMETTNELLVGKKTTEAREIIVSWLRENNLLEKEEEINQNVSTAERTGGIIEPLPKLQWFIDVNKEFILVDSKIKDIPSGSKTTLKEIMKKTVSSGQVNIIPDYFNKTYFHWIDNLRDWCISRQIWYGHRIPVWYKTSKMSDGTIVYDAEKMEDIKIYCDTIPPNDIENWTQDTDTLDTWFSSALWTFSTLGWPENTEDLKTYHPTDVLETGYEILFFWVARMILMSGYILGDIPFKNVYLHGTVRDGQGRKMSKSLGNGIDPIEIAEKYGADAGRMALIVGTAPGTDSKISEDKIKGYKHFANKIWNISRFVFSQNHLDDTLKLNEKDENIYNEWRSVFNEITLDLENFRLHLASEKIYQYIWHTFADNIIEESKKIFSNSDTEEQLSRKTLLVKILKENLKALHPFMPFVTEEIWKTFKKDSDDLLIIQKW